MTDKKRNLDVRFSDFNFDKCSQFKEFKYEHQITPIQKRMYFLMVHSKMPRGENESLYGWTGRIGLSRSTVFGIFNKGNSTMHNSVASKISLATGADEDWIRHGAGVPFPIYSYDEIIERQIEESIEEDGLVISTQIDKPKLQQAFETTEQALKDQHKIMQPGAKSEFIVMLYTALIDISAQPFDNQLLKTAIFNLENELEKARRSMSPYKKTLLIIAIYTLYIGDASNKEAIEQTTIQLVRSAA
ncbi:MULTISPECIES: hypothetical protein [unclassified Acinetobacter]|uniref:hypothetical protein n=1 Tax=unclassified Acinetobacter TaxID=196816 RepID=UPI00190A0DFC|nr:MULTISPECIES: hypothetical protein [unclassified Acinetobacter]MBK0062418.1 hypothetical protein [Acinetobacter sp. S55]MBK0066222.1 hypothetical protein [Acinetobacter sp. S54]